MPIEVTMPKLSDTMEEGKILHWVKQVGDAVRPGDVLAEVETDKANMELEAYDEGVLSEVRVGEGQSAPVGAVIAILGGAVEKGAPPAARQGAPSEGDAEPAERPAKAPRKAMPEQPAPRQVAAPQPPARQPATSAPAGKASAARPPAAGQPASGQAARPEVEQAAEPRCAPVAVRSEPARPAQEGDAVRASPLARRLASEHGVDLHAVSGTGPGGRVVEKDVQGALGAGSARRAAPPATPAAPSAPPAAGGRQIELSRIRRTTAKRMAEAKRDVPHFYASADLAMDEAVRLKEGLAALAGEYADVTFTHLILKATGLALARVPEVNATYEGDTVRLHETVNIGLATALDDGLIVPVVRDCDRQPLAEIVRQVRGLLERARAGRFAGDDLSGGTFTVSNLGMFPVSHFAAVINPPQAAILAVGTIREVPVVRDGRIVPGRTMSVTLSSDHRVIDGVVAGRFLRELKTLLEAPLALLT